MATGTESRVVYGAGVAQGIVLVHVPLPLEAQAGRAASTRGFSVPSRFWAYAAFALLYGFCETANGNWLQ